ncbi:GNAT family N-acetyltransferase [Nocardia cyriacigeorgica]|uniref:GNAT family N-acetyltransferase n=1 Tax=Nocardia cyriacigeorgica TaxID=135487 RepID=UPI00189537F0|nr:GNAT family N-acetyltransferase [Nocardia cyriacigeorgica]MBF6413431.1 GNAT family N-acetyltransferase [Nocardia cyriacigeorgica]
MTVTDAVTIREADDDDIPVLARLRRSWSEEQAGRPLDDSEFDERFAQWHAAESSRRQTFVAEVDGRAVGMVNLVFFERMPRPGQPGSRWAYLANAFVLAECRSRGIGTALLDAVIERGRARGCVRIVLSPSEQSLSLYQRAGFAPATMLLARKFPPAAQ